jgi:hypothetical protein
MPANDDKAQKPTERQPTHDDPAELHKPGETFVPTTVETVDGPKDHDEAPDIDREDVKT